MNRYVCHFSCGAASAVATKLVLARVRENPIIVVNAFIREEHEDNRRFLRDCEKWFDYPITVLASNKYNASTMEVWRRKRFMKGPKGAPCSQELKRKLLKSIEKPYDINILGFTAEEADRLADRREHAPNQLWEAPLIDAGLTKADCLAMVDRAGIELPYMYKLGFTNANCIGCVKGGQNYWQRIREQFPERFVQIQTLQEEIGPGAYFLRHRSGPKKGERMPLRELPEGRGNLADEPDFSCSFSCEVVEQEYTS